MNSIAERIADAVKSANWKASKLNAVGHLDVDETQTRFSQGSGVCEYCYIKLTDANLTLDHVTPFSLGGNNELHNIVFACKTCNSRKGHQTLADFKRRYQNREDGIWKLCKGCNQHKPLTLAYFYACPSCFDGYNATCKTCKRSGL